MTTNESAPEATAGERRTMCSGGCGTALRVLPRLDGSPGALMTCDGANCPGNLQRGLPATPDADDASECPTHCDPDCNVACHEAHQVEAKRDHDVRTCIQRQCAAINASTDASEPLTEGERTDLSHVVFPLHYADPDLDAVCAVVERIKAAAATKARADERERIAQAVLGCREMHWTDRDLAARIARGDA